MKNTLLCSALFTLMCASVHADVPATAPSQPAQATPETVPAIPAAPSLSQDHTPPAPPTVASVIDCNYKMEAGKAVEPTVLLSWSEKATAQAFDLDANTIDSQLQKLQTCFTDQGWTGFKSALDKSGNIDAIKKEHLNVSSQVDGVAAIVESNENQWKVTLPLHVVYQNDKEKVTQLLNINLTVGRKVNGDLGIMQMIATPRATITPAAAPTTTTTTTAPADSTAPAVKTDTSATTVPPATEQPAAAPATTTVPPTPGSPAETPADNSKPAAPAQ